MKIICVGMNYAKHVDELHGQDFKRPEHPVIFMKPDSAILRVNTPFYIPDFASEFHYETELVVKINRLGRAINKKFAHRYYSEVGIGIDFTARDLQRKLMSQGLPWEISKGFDQSAAISEFIPLAEAGGDINNIDFHLDIDGQRRQTGNTGDMLFSVDEIIAYVSQFFTLKMGDLIYTGTPAGVGPVKEGERLEAYIGDKKLMDFLIK
ncbi:MAG: fumarylacetoacetate hydrolase family protein [Bacteroidales bacterium]|nr:fumarylacetoacetate hydrolase family protein [Bacteroidales bacterium]